MSSRAREIEQGLREPSGCLTFCLVAEEYGQGFIDFQAQSPWPADASPSYELGRARAGEREGDRFDLLAKLKRERDEANARVRAMLADRPEALAEFDARMAAIGPMRAT